MYPTTFHTKVQLPTYFSFSLKTTHIDMYVIGGYNLAQICNDLPVPKLSAVSNPGSLNFCSPDS